MIRRNITRIASAVTSPNRFSVDVVCSSDNRVRCMKNLQNMPAIKLSNEPPTRSAAVLIPLVEHDGRLGLLYTVRAANMTRHSNEVSFPGGIRDPSDDSFAACAVREAQEECGFRKDQIDIWGEGRMMITRANAPSITPVVGFIRDYDPTQMRLSPNEVAEAFVVPLEVLCDADNPRHTQFRAGNAGYSVPSFLGGSHRIWGITGVITHMFLTALLPEENLYGRRTVQYLSTVKNKL